MHAGETEPGPLVLDWEADELSGGGSRLFRDVRSAVADSAQAGIDLTPASWHATVLRAARWAPRDRPLLTVTNDRLLHFDLEDQAEPAVVHIQIAVAPSTLSDPPPSWSSWQWTGDHRIRQPDLPSRSDEIIYTARLTVGGVLRPLNLPRDPITASSVRTTLETAIEEVNALAIQALSLFAGPSSRHGCP